ncbi:MAG: SDR family NAD(P)-dependent oxidoreductase [Rhodovarius sp.]|nr:SDR family NAD(P)-dependent oxidoreductase [Rhodovarius sp.]
MTTLAGQIAWITGASRGIGRAMALLFAREGADIAFNHLEDDAAAEAMAPEIRAIGRRACHLSADMGEAAAIRRFAAAAKARSGCRMCWSTIPAASSVGLLRA